MLSLESGKMQTKIQLIECAKRLGAVKCRISCTKTRYSLYHRRKVWEPFIYYFFDANDDEICHFFAEMGLNINGLKIWAEPRIWGEEFKTALDIYECTPNEALNPQINNHLL